MLADQYRIAHRASMSRNSTGAGAAGGLAGGLAAIGAELAPGFDVVAEAVGLEAALEGADLAITGEGKLDRSSLAGKVVGGVLAWADDLDVANVAIIAGQVTDDARADARGPSRTFKCSRSPIASGSRARRTRAPRCSWKKLLSRRRETRSVRRHRDHRRSLADLDGLRGDRAVGCGAQQLDERRASPRVAVRRGATRWP